MPLGACENCRHELDSLAECPHCKYAQPELIFQKGHVCPGCGLKNHISLANCRDCGELLVRLSTPMQRWRAWRETRNKLQRFAFLGAVVGAIVWLSYVSFIQKTFEDPTMHEPLSKIFVFGIHVFLGGGIGWIVGMILGAFLVIFHKSKSAR